MLMTSSSGSKPNPTVAPVAPAEILRHRLRTKTATIAVVGLGYVGLPLVRAVHSAGFRAIGFDTDTTKISTLRQGGSYLHHLGEELARTLAASDKFEATSSPKSLAAADAVLLCVPTPLGPHREPDLSFVIDSTKMIATMLRKGQLVVLD